ncbi:MAG: hypothetical protein ACO3RV_10380, partial [Luteolibacter sp.]
SDNDRQQALTASDIRWIEEDLGNFHARTKDEQFLEILELMRESRIDEGLEEIRSLLSSNHSYQAAENSKIWADHLNEWAAKLQGAAEDPANGGGDGGGAPNAEDEDFEFMLRVMKMIQQEQDLRARTRALEQLRREPNAEP